MIKNAYVLLEQFDDMVKPLIVKLFAERANVYVSEDTVEDFVRLTKALDEHLSENETYYAKEHEEMKVWKNKKETKTK